MVDSVLLFRHQPRDRREQSHGGQNQTTTEGDRPHVHVRHSPLHAIHTPLHRDLQEGHIEGQLHLQATFQRLQTGLTLRLTDTSPSSSVLKLKSLLCLVVELHIAEVTKSSTNRHRNPRIAFVDTANLASW